VDVHVHIQPWEQMLPDVAAAMKRGRDDVELVERLIRDPDALVALMDEQGIARVGLINYPSQDLMGFDARTNDFVASYRDRHPSRFIAFGGMHPRFVDDPAKEMHRLLHELRLDAIKVHPPHQLVRANAHAEGGEGAEALRVLYAACEAAAVPVMIHTGTSVFPKARGKYGDPMDTDDVAVDFPRLKILLAHGGRPIWMTTAVQLVRRHRNVHLELSGIPPKSLLEYFPKLESLADKCLFGTDYPSPGVTSIRRNVDEFLSLPLSSDAKARILAGTADELFPPR
jgi:predicted TIM-barrel fold metal-dependent hydrolase